MAKGSNDKRSNKTNIPNPSSSSSQQQSSVTSSPSLVPNNPHRTKNPVFQLSGTFESFNNHNNGSQVFSNATIKSSKTEYSYNNHGPGSQTFKGAEIHGVDRSSAKLRLNSILTGNQTMPWPTLKHLSPSTTAEPDPRLSTVSS